MKTGIWSFTLLILVVNNAFAQSAAEYYERGLKAFSEEKISESYIFLKNALQQDPGHLPSKLLMGKVLFIDGYLDDAITEFEEVLSGGVDINLVAEPIAQAYLLARRYEDVIDISKHNGLREDSAIRTAILAAQAYQRLGQSEMANSLTNKLTSQYAQHPDVQIMQIKQDLENGYLENAGERLARLEAYAGKMPDYTLLRARWMMLSGKLFEAIEVLKNLLLSYPEHPTAMRELASLYVTVDDIEQAQFWVNKIDTQTPNDLLNKVLKARLLMLTGKMDEAQPILTALTSQFSLLGGESSEQRNELALVAGITAFLTNNFSIAETELARYLSGNEATPEVIAMLMQSMLNVGKRREAIKLADKHLNVVAKSEASVVLACELFIQAKRDFKCEEVLSQAQRIYPDSIKLHLAKAKLIAVRDKVAAVRYVDQFVGATPSLDVVSFVAILQGELGEYQKALSMLQKLSQTELQQTGMQNLLVDLLLRTQQIEEAALQSERRLRVAPEDPAGLINDARVKLSLGQPQEAIKQLKLATTLNKSLNQARLLGAQIYAQTNQTALGIEWLLEAKSLDMKSEDVRQLLVALYVQNNEPNNALAELDQLLKMNRLNPVYRQKRAEILINIGRYPAALEEIRTFIPMLNEPSALLNAAQMQAQVGDNDGALITVDTVLGKQPDYTPAQILKTQLLMQSGKFDTAYEFVASMLRKSPEVIPLNIKLAQILFEQKAFKRSLAAADKVLKLDDTEQLVHILLYELSDQPETTDAALLRLSNLTERYPDNLFLLHLTADAQMKAGNTKAAGEKYERLAVVLDLPRRDSVLNNLALITAEQNVSKGIHYAEEAVSLNQNSASINDTLGWLYARAGEYTKALEYLRGASVMNASDPAIQFHLAFVLEKLGRKPEARQIMQQYKPHLTDIPEKEAAIILYKALQ